MRKVAIKELVKNAKIKASYQLFTISVPYSSSLYVLIDKSVIYLGEITHALNDHSGCEIILTGDDQSRRILRQYVYQNINLVVKTKNTYAFEASVKLNNVESVNTDRWEMSIHITRLGQIVKV